MSSLKSEHIFDLHLFASPSANIAPVASGTRIVAGITGGSFEGANLRGAVLPVGADWMTMGADGVMMINVQIVLQTNDGAAIMMTYGGRIVVPPELMPRIFDPSQVEGVDPDAYYFRVTPHFEAAADSPYAWLNSIVAVGVGRIVDGGVRYSIHAIR